MYTKTHKYKGTEIRPCGCQCHIDYTGGEGNNTGYWYIVVYHQTGVRIFESQSPHYRTLAGARAYIDMKIEMNKK